MQLFKRFFESAPEKLSIPERILRVLTTKDNPRFMEGHEEQYGIFTKWIRHRVIAPVRVAMLLTLLGVAAHLPATSETPKTQTKPSSPVPTASSDSQKKTAESVPEIPASFEVLRLQAGNPEADTVWDLVTSFLVRHKLPSDTTAVTRIVRAFEKQYPDVDPSTLQDGQEIIVRMNNGRISVELGDMR